MLIPITNALLMFCIRVVIPWFSLIFRLHNLPVLSQLQIIYHIEFIIDSILGVETFVRFLAHVLLESWTVFECSLTEQAFQTV